MAVRGHGEEGEGSGATRRHAEGVGSAGAEIGLDERKEAGAVRGHRGGEGGSRALKGHGGKEGGT